VNVVLALPLGLAAALAQPFEREGYAIPITANTAVIEHPWVGGFYNPAHQFADIDGDGDYDLFILDANDLSFQFFRNIGSPQTPVFRFRSLPFVAPPVSGWFRFNDIDGDGKLDLLTAGDSINSLAIYRNTGTLQSPQFTLIVPSLRDTSNHLVYVQFQCIPALTDIDADGDLDFFSLNPGSGTINFYQNVGNANTFLLAFITDFWQNIRICPGCSGPENPLHGQGTMYFADVDGDSDFDMFYGDLFDPGLFFYQNIGTPANAILDSVSGHFPPVNPIITGGFNQPTLVDIDGDGDSDLFVSVLPPFQQVDNLYFYRNIGTAANYDFSLVTKNYIATLDLGIQSAPAFYDIDADGDQDALVGDLFGRVALLRNTGTATAPFFDLEDSSFIPTGGNFSYVPAFADLDGDGDGDLLLGNFAGRIEFYRNVGSPSLPQFSREISFFDSVNVGNYAAPALMDIDDDGDLDLFVGKSDGRIAYFRNNGTAQVWSFALQTSSFLNINIGANAKPTFADIDGDGDRDLLIGGSDGKLHFHRNDGPPSNPGFVFVTDTFASIDRAQEVVPAFVDIDGDGDLDMFVGHLRGGLDFYVNQRIASGVVDTGRLPGSFALFQNYPNPFNPVTHLKFHILDFARPNGEGARGFVSLKVFDLLGREVAVLVNEELMPGEYRVTFDASGFSSGTYFYRLQAGGYSETRKLLLLR